MTHLNMATLFFVVVDPDEFGDRMEWPHHRVAQERNTTQITNLHGPTAKEVGPVIII
jgi:hypothetical protein